MTKVSVIILSWNRKGDTLETLESLSKSVIKDFQLEIIVVDNGSTDGSVEAIEKYSRKFASAAIKVYKGKRGEAARIRDNSRRITFKLIKNRTNLGFAEGNNVGMRYALDSSADYIVLLNDDTIVDKNLLVNLVKEVKRQKKAGAISPKIYFAKGYEFHKKRYRKKELGKVIWYAGGDIDWNNVYGSNHGVDSVDKGQFDKVTETDFTTGCCVIFRREVLKSTGLYNSRYFAYLEDAELSQRIRKAGWRVLYTPHAHLWHKVSQSSGIGSELNDYFITRNRLLFGLKYASLRTKLALFRESLRLLVKGRKWQKIGVRDFYLRRFGKGSWR
jgi:GT2 family glycosyltransferase